MAVLGLRFCARATLHRGARASHYRGLSCCGAQAPDAQTQQLWLTGPVAPWHVGSSQTRARTCVPCISRQILNHCATREAPLMFSLSSFCTSHIEFIPNINMHAIVGEILSLISTWFPLLNLMSVRFIHVVRKSSLFFWILNSIPVYLIYYKLFIHSPIDGHLANMNKAAVNDLLQGFLKMDICLHFSLVTS